MFIPTFSYLLEDLAESPIIEGMFFAYEIFLLIFCMVIILFSFIINCPMRNLYRFGMIFLSPHAFISAVLPSFYSIVAIAIWIGLGLYYRTGKNVIVDEKKGIVSSNPRYRKKEEIAFKEMTREEQNFWLENRLKIAPINIPVIYILLMTVLPFLLGVYITSFA